MRGAPTTRMQPTQFMVCGAFLHYELMFIPTDWGAPGGVCRRRFCGGKRRRPSETFVFDRPSHLCEDGAFR